MTKQEALEIAVKAVRDAREAVQTGDGFAVWSALYLPLEVERMAPPAVRSNKE